MDHPGPVAAIPSQVVGRGGLEPPTSAVWRRERRGVEFLMASDVAGRYQQ